jgi:hypothetical protein
VCFDEFLEFADRLLNGWANSGLLFVAHRFASSRCWMITARRRSREGSRAGLSGCQGLRYWQRPAPTEDPSPLPIVMCSRMSGSVTTSRGGSLPIPRTMNPRKTRPAPLPANLTRPDTYLARLPLRRTSPAPHPAQPASPLHRRMPPTD